MSLMIAELYEAFRAAGVDEPTARKAAESVPAELATKADLSAAVTELRGEIRAGLADLRAGLAETRAELIKWNVGTILAAAGVGTAIAAMLR